MTASHTPVRVFVSPAGNQFFDDIAHWLVEAARMLGRDATLAGDGLPDASGSIDLVVAPHEFFELSDAPTADLQRAAAACVPVCTEQPGTPWFRLTEDVCRRARLAIDINPHGVAALRGGGVVAEHLRLGAVPSMCVGDPSGPRSTDVLFMGGLDDRRGAVLADLAPRWHRRAIDLRLFKFERPSRDGVPGLVLGQQKFELLADAKVLVNIHRDRPAGADEQPYFEWARMVEAMANGCVVVTEPSEGSEPLQAGVHFVEADVASLADAVDALLDDEASRLRIAQVAREDVTGPLALAGSLAPLLDRIERDVLPGLADHVRRSRPTKGVWRLGASKVPLPVRLPVFTPHLDLHREAKRIAFAENAALRRLDAAACLLHHGEHQHVVELATPAYAAAAPEVTVVVSLYDYASVVTETLDSIVASEDVAFEVVVVEDHATDTSRHVVEAYLREHPDVPMRLIAKDANEGLAAARNTGFEVARAELVMVMDADNHVYPTCLRRLADALLTEPDAAAAYAALEDFGVQRNIRSCLGWDVERLCQANYIDAQAMWRKWSWEQLGGYRADDDHVYGWEDWDLWLRLALAGGHATLVRQALGRYRVQESSMISLTNLAASDSLAAIEARYPTLPWPERR